MTRQESEAYSAGYDDGRRQGRMDVFIAWLQSEGYISPELLRAGRDLGIPDADLDSWLD